MACRHRAISLSKKIELIDAVEAGTKFKSEIAASFGLSKSTLSTIIKNKVKLRELYESSTFEPERKRLRIAAYCDIEEALFTWFKPARSTNVPVSGPILMIKAKELAVKLGHQYFNCSTGWLRRFKARHNIVFRKVTGEEGSVSEDMLSEWNSSQLPALLRKFSPDDIFNADETGLFWKCLSDKTLSLKGDKCSGGKRSKDRVTVLVCANMSGSEKLPLLVIGRFAKPRCFKNARSIPVQYEANKKAWMVSELFSSWLLKLDRKFEHEKHKIAMVLDNCPAHPV